MLNYDYIFRSFVSGDVEPFYKDLYPGLMAYAVSRLGDELAYLAEDCVQDAVLTSYSIREGFGTSMAWYAYIMKCISHSAVHLHRKYNSHAAYLGELDSERTDEADVLEQEVLDGLYAVIRSLPEDYQQILWMSYREGLKNAEIAERLGVAEITVKKKKAKILAALRERLGDISPVVLLAFFRLLPA